MKTAIIPADEAQAVRIEDPDELTYEYLRECVGGYLQAVEIGDLNLYLNEEGKLEGRPINRRATELALANQAIFADDVIVGDVVLIGPADDDGNETGLSEEALAWVDLLVRRLFPQILERERKS